MSVFSSIHMKTATLLVAGSLILSGCFVQPGKFRSELALLDNDQFTFTYDGEVHFIGLAKIMEESKRSSQGEFQSYCYGPVPQGADDAVEAAVDAAEAAADAATEAAELAIAESYSDGTRDCTPEEEAQQRTEWEERQARRIEKDKREAEQFSKITGGIDFSDPDAEQELAAMLLRQKGFNSVEVKGDGVFDISYAIQGTISHDYMFPVMEGFPTSSPFVQMIVRDGSTVRINAPAFAGQMANNPMAMFMLGMPGMGSGMSAAEQEELNLPEVDGSFSIVTTGEIRANNTDEGPIAEAGRQRLTWQINSRTKAPPTALIAMSR
ncbi:MAG: hypothetical protein AAGL10_13415 [Pseudomonadota bacterium]